MLSTTRKRALASICAAMVLTAGTGGLASAQTTAPPTPGQQVPGEAAHHHDGLFAIAAQAIGINPQQLHQELQGKSLATVAQAHGKNPADVAAALKTASDAHIDQLMNHVWQTEEEGATKTPEPAGS